MKKAYLFTCLFGLCAVFLSAQCVKSGSFIINDFGITRIQIPVTGLVNNQLSNIDQGLCGVGLRFRHDKVSDIFIELESPSGQSITLAGPSGPFNALTNGTIWDVSFVPTRFSAMPDLNFGDRWSNRNSWGNFAFHSGSYYPFSGNLENFNTGNPNGVWTLIIRDGLQFNEGVIEEVTLLFCDDTGLFCQNCDLPKAQNQSGLSSSFCVDETIGKQINFEDSLLDNDHQLLYYLLEEDSIIYAADSNNVPFGLAAGSYRYCPLTVESNQLNIWQSLNQSNTRWLSLLDEASRNDICFSIIDSCHEIEVLPTADTATVAFTLCDGDTLILGEDTIAEAGIYVLENEIDSICAEIIEVQVFRPSLAINLDGIDTISCRQSEITVELDSQAILGYEEILWVDTSGVIAQNQLNLQINKGGQYSVRVSVDDCFVEEDFTIEVLSTDAFIQIDTSGVYNCRRDSFQLTFQSRALDSIFWRFEGREDTLFADTVYAVSTEETVWIYGFDSLGCLYFDSLRLIKDTAAAEVSIIFQSPICPGSFSELIADENPNVEKYEWSGPNGFFTTNRDTFTQVPGSYILTTIHSRSGCIFRDTVSITNHPPTIPPRVSSDSISCQQASVQLVLDSIDTLLTYVWTTPSGASISEAEPTVSEIGNYRLRITDTNNCVEIVVHRVLPSMALPSLTIVGDTIGCNDTSAMLTFIAQNISFPDQIFWVNPQFDTIFSDTLQHLFPGNYKLFYREGNCQVVDSFEVIEEFPSFNHQFATDTLDCNTDTFLLEISGPDSLDYTWEDPFGNRISGQAISVSDSGEYIVTVNNNGCSYRRRTTVFADFKKPTFNFNYSRKNCENPDHLIVFDSSIVAFLNNAPLDANRFQTSNDGTYNFTVESTNGCQADTSIEFQEDFSTPNLGIAVETFDCKLENYTARLIGSSDNIRFIDWYQQGIYLGRGDSILYSGPQRLEYLVTFENGCSTTRRRFIPIPTDTAKPVFDFSIPTITCDEPRHRLNITNRGPAIDSVKWIFPGGRLEVGDSVFTSAPGRYTLSVVGENGCGITDTFILPADLSLPRVTISGDTIACNTSQSRLLATVNLDSLRDFFWQDERGFNFNNLFLNADSGRYRFIVEANNGCVDTTEVEMFIKRFNIEVSNFPDTIMTLDCRQDIYNIFPDFDREPASLEWITPTGRVIGRSLTISDTGNYFYVIEQESKCFDTLTIVMNRDTMAPLTQIFGSDSINCYTPSRLLRAINVEPKLQLEWRDPNMTLSNNNAILAQDSGLYILTAIDSGGCVTVDSLRMYSDFDPPNYDIRDTFYSNCETDSVQLFISQGGWDISWVYNGSVVNTDTAFSTLEKGIYTLTTLRVRNGCSRMDTVVASKDVEFPQANWDIPVLSCSNEVDSIRILNEHRFWTFNWMGPQGFTNQNSEIEVSDSGKYIVQYTNEINCTSTDELTVRASSEQPEFNLIQTDDLRCLDNKGRIQLNLSNSLADTNITWRSEGGQIVSQSNFEIETEDPGLFVVTIEDEINNCFGTDSIQIDYEPPIPPRLDVDVRDFLCATDNSAGFQIIPLDIGRVPLSVSFEGAPHDTILNFSELTPGMYSLEIIDRQGCVLDTTITVRDLVDMQLVDLGEDQELSFGDSVTVIPEYSFDTQRIVSVSWLEDLQAFCNDCSFIQLNALENSSLVEVSVLTDGGCILRDEVIYSIPNDQVIFVPNVFSPNGDGRNDIFHIFTENKVQKIDLWEIYMRSGDRVFQAVDVPMGIRTEYGWDGTFNGQPLHPQTLVVKVEYEILGDRRVEYYDLTLLR